jgi:hypothetical protein
LTGKEIELDIESDYKVNIGRRQTVEAERSQLTACRSLRSRKRSRRRRVSRPSNSDLFMAASKCTFPYRLLNEQHVFQYANATCLGPTTRLLPNTISPLVTLSISFSPLEEDDGWHKHIERIFERT